MAGGPRRAGEEFAYAAPTPTIAGYKDPDRFDKWVAVLQERASYEEPIVLPLGEGLNVERGGAGLVVRCDCGHDFCASDRNWKMHAAVHEFLPDIEGFYRGWLGREVP